MMLRPLSVLILLLSVTFSAHAVIPAGDSARIARTRWVDSVYQSLDTNERIAQLLMARAYTSKDSAYLDSVASAILRNNVGGVCFFKGTPHSQASMTNRLQDSIRTPLLTAIDAEWGMGMRIDSAFVFPYSMTLGAVSDDSLVFRMASQVGRDCRRLGLNFNFAPVADVNNNPANPVINVRSFGEDPVKVGHKAVMYMKGIQEQGVVATGKHFPGHGDTDTDSHLALPLIPHDRRRLDSVELYPFRELIREGVTGIMIAHLYIPAIDSTPNVASTLSRPVVTGLLKEQMGFSGFVITDALDMQGVTRYFPPGEVEVRALEAGNDILLLPKNIDAAVTGIRRAVDSLRIPWAVVEGKCRHILELKYDLGLAHLKRVETAGLVTDLNPRSSVVLNTEIYRQAVTVLRNEGNILPLTMLDRRRTAFVAIGDSLQTPFQAMAGMYCPFNEYHLPVSVTKKVLDSLAVQLSGADRIILSFHVHRIYPENNFGISRQVIDFADSLALAKRTVLVLFGNPYVLRLFKDAKAFDGIVVTYQDRPEAEQCAAQVIFGGQTASGRLPVTACNGFRPGDGLDSPKNRLGFVFPEENGIPEASLARIDSIAQEGIAAGAYPGCQVILARNGNVFYDKAFGHPAYGDSIRVTTDDLYDLASLTKILATTLAVMKLNDEGKVSLDEKLSDHIAELRGTDKSGITVRQVMAHEAGLQAWIPFFRKTLKNGFPDTTIYSAVETPAYPVRVAEGLYIRSSFQDTILDEIIHSELASPGQYRYSDLGFYLLRVLVERVSHRSFDQYVRENFYAPMGLTTLGFEPAKRYPLSRIMPTENDTTFRRQILRGDVHDPGAAMIGGISGHAGLFSDSFDVAVILQMLLNYGEYGGKQYILPSTIKEFTRVQFPEHGNRRGLGFDKPPLEPIPDGPVCESASHQSFGHSGFTGTYCWADPVNGLIYVFLSNRINPDAANNKLSSMNIRTRIHQAAYEALEQVKTK